MSSNINIANIFTLPPELSTEEFFESLVETESISIGRVISTGQTTPPGEWYDQERDEWVILLQGEAKLAYEDGTIATLGAGDYVLIGAHQKHRVEIHQHRTPLYLVGYFWLAVLFVIVIFFDRHRCALFSSESNLLK